MIRKLLLLILLLPSLAFGQNYEAAVKALGPTGWWKGYYGNTVDTSTLLASSLRDFSGNNRIFTQAVAANQALATRQDNRENQLIYSGDISNVIWTPTLATKNDSTHFTVTAQYGYVGQIIPTISTVNYTYCVTARVVSGNTNLHLVGFDSGSSNIVAKTLTATLADYCAAFAGRVGGGNVQFGIQDRNAAGWGQIEVTRQWVYTTTLADSTYLATSLAPAFRGVSGIPAFRFDGVNDYYTSTATLGNVFAAGAKTFFLVIRPSKIGGAQYIFTNGANSFYIFLDNTGHILINNYDGNWDAVQAVTPVLTAGTIAIIEGRHESGNIYLKVNSGTEYSSASGNTTGLGNTIELAAVGGTSSFSGDIVETILFNTALSVSNRQTVYDYLSWTLSNPWKRVEVTP